MKLKAFGAIDLLIALLIMAAAFMVGINAFKTLNSTYQTQDTDIKTVQEHINDQITEIEDARKMSEELQKEFQKDF